MPSQYNTTSDADHQKKKVKNEKEWKKVVEWAKKNLLCEEWRDPKKLNKMRITKQLVRQRYFIFSFNFLTNIIWKAANET